MSRCKLRHWLAMSALLGLPAFTCGVGPVVLDLQERVAALEDESDSELLVVDSGWIQVGENADFSNGQPSVSFDLDGVPLFRLDLTRYAVVGTRSATYFDAPGCNGQPYLPDSDTRLLPGVFVRTDLATELLVGDQGTAAQFVSVQSRLLANGTCSPEVRSDILLVPATPAFVWQNKFNPPFRMFTRGEFLGFARSNRARAAVEHEACFGSSLRYALVGEHVRRNASSPASG